MPTPSKPFPASGTRFTVLGLVFIACASSPPPVPGSTPENAATSQPREAETGVAPGKNGTDRVANCTPDATRMDGPYRYNNNQWGRDKTKGRTEQCLLTRDENGHIEAGWTWNWPGFDPSVFAYPEIEFGWKPWSGGASTDKRFPMRVSDVPQISLHYEVETQADGSYDLAPEVWLTNSPATSAANPKSITTEVMFWMDYAGGAKPAGQVVATPTFDGAAYELWKADNIGAQANGKGWVLLSFKSTTRKQKGTIPIDTMLKHLVASKLANPADYVSGVEFGNEVMGGSGTTWVKRFEVEVSGTPM